MDSRQRLTQSYCHRGGRVPLIGATIPQHFAEVVRQHGERDAVVCLPQQRRFTYRQMHEAVNALAKGLLGMGFARGDRIGIWSTNNIEWLLLQMATAQVGIVLVNINPAYRPRELAYALERSEVQGLFVIPAFRTSDYVAMLTELVPELTTSEAGHLRSARLPMLRRIVIYDPAAPMDTHRPATGFTTWAEALAAGDAVARETLDEALATLDRDDSINIQYTSGTTGFPKAVVLTHHNILNNAYFTALAMHFGPDDRLAVSVPFYHCFGMVLANLLCVSIGACLVVPCEHFDPDLVLEAIQAEGCTAVHGVPTMFIAMLDHPEFKRFDLRSLRTGIMAGAPCPPELMRRVIEDMHCPEILIGYGETEASPLTHLTTRDDSLERRLGSVGTNLPTRRSRSWTWTAGRRYP
jgi:fatty-acyl-CoA synthase